MILSINDLDLNKSYTYFDYLIWQFTEKVELIKGKIVLKRPARIDKHQAISGNLLYFIKTFLLNKKYQLRTAPYDVRFVKNIDYKIFTTVLQPDLCVICDRTKIDEKGCLGSPDFIIEILSPNTQKLDLIHKYSIFEEYGVKEYWIVYPKDEIIDTFI